MINTADMTFTVTFEIAASAGLKSDDFGELIFPTLAGARKFDHEVGEGGVVLSHVD